MMTCGHSLETTAFILVCSQQSLHPQQHGSDGRVSAPQLLILEVTVTTVQCRHPSRYGQTAATIGNDCDGTRCPLVLQLGLDGLGHLSIQVMGPIRLCQ